MKKEEKKEEKIKEEKVVDYTIEEGHQGKLKSFSKTIYIIAKILEVFACIAIVFLFLAMICIPIAASGVKVNNGEGINNIEIFGQKINYTRDDDKIIFYEDDKYDSRDEITDKSQVNNINYLLDYMEKKDITKVAIIVEVDLVLITISLFVIMFILKKVNLLFRHIYDIQ